MGGGDVVEFILWLQSFSSPLLDRFFILVTDLGHEDFYMLLLPILYWCVDKRLGIRLGSLFLSSMFVNFYVKDLFMLPRPEGGGIRILYPESGGGYGFPSGHTQGNATVWGYLMHRFRARWLIVLGSVIVFLVALSRLYLGVHYPSDILGGLALAVALIFIFNRAAPVMSGLSFNAKMGLAVVLPLAGLAIYREPDAFKLVGFLLGLGTGYLLESRLVGWEAPALPWQHLVKVVLGAAVFFGLRVATSPLFGPGLPQVLRYCLMSWWVALAAPYVFTRLGLYRRTPGLGA